MKANEFVKRFGLERAKQFVNADHTAHALVFATTGVSFIDLKRLVESWELVEKLSEFNNLISMLNDKNDIILSQQAKIDCMQVRLDGANERALSILNHKNVMVDKMQAEIDELQGRIDRVAHILTYTNHASTPLCNELRDILKGNKDEN